MNLFEKIFNYGLLSRLEDNSITTLTAHERSWLKTMLRHPDAELAFEPETLEKLNRLLVSDMTIEFEEQLIEKAGSVELQVYHPLLRPLRRFIRDRSTVQLSYSLKHGGIKSGQLGLPYKLEYSMVKKEWYLLWYHLRYQRPMVTRLQKLDTVIAHGEPMTEERYEVLQSEIRDKLEAMKISAHIRVIPTYNVELSRILYAFSPFEKEVLYDTETDTYTVKLTFSRSESEYVLSKLRFLGKRVYIEDNIAMRKRMYDSASMALARYGESE